MYKKYVSEVYSFHSLTVAMFCGHCIIRPNISTVAVVSDVPFQSKKSQELKVQKAATVSEPVDELAVLRAAAL